MRSAVFAFGALVLAACAPAQAPDGVPDDDEADDARRDRLDGRHGPDVRLVRRRRVRQPRARWKRWGEQHCKVVA